MEEIDTQKQQLKEYVNYLFSKGYSKNQIREKLIEKGFDRFLVREIVYPNLKLFVSAGIIFILVILVIGGFFAYSLIANTYNGSALNTKEKIGKYTIGEIVSKGASEGPNFCNTLEADSKKICMESYLSNKTKQESLKNSSNLSSKPVFALNRSVSPEDPDYAYLVISSLDKENCSKIKTQRQTLCINGIDLIGNALAAKNVSLCFNESINVDQKTRMMCTMRLSSQRLGGS